MRLPESIRIGGHTIKVMDCHPADLGSSGHFDSNYFQIRIKNDKPESAKAETLMHECLEAIAYLNNLSLDHKDLTIISEQLFSIIRNNKLRFDDES